MGSLVCNVLLSLVIFSSVCETSFQQMVFYISLSNDDPQNFALTFADLASNMSHYNDPTDRVTLIFETGIHVVESDMSIENISELTMLSNGTISTTTCNESSNLRFETIGYVQINALEFIGCSN